jgi:hypothetical protein
MHEKLSSRLAELEEREEERILSERIERLEMNPSASVPWRDVRRQSNE